VSAAKDTLGTLYDSHGDKVRYLMVGVCNTAISYLLFLALLATLGPLLQSLEDSSVGLLALAGMATTSWFSGRMGVDGPVSTTTMKYFAFRSRGRLMPQIARGYMVYLPAQGLSSLILWLTVRVAGLSPAVGQLVAIVFMTVFSYLGHKYFTFRVPVEVAELGDPPHEEPSL